MKCQILSAGKKKKNISINCLLKRYSKHATLNVKAGHLPSLTLQT